MKDWRAEGRRPDWTVSLAFAAGLFTVLFGLSLWLLVATAP